MPPLPTTILLLLFFAFAGTSGSEDQYLTTSKDREVSAAIKEMQKANYFTFVTLINMVIDKLPPNATFLMPNDRILATSKFVDPEEGGILEFLLRHSVPSPMLYDDMKHFPTGTAIPTYQTNYTLKILNNGRKDFWFNNVRLVSINLCMSGAAFRCHGVDGVLGVAESGSKKCTGTAAAPSDAASPSISRLLPSSPSQSPPVVDPSVVGPTVSPTLAVPSTGSAVLASAFHVLGFAPVLLWLLART